MDELEWTQYRAMVQSAYAAAESGLQWGGARTALDDGYSRWMREQNPEDMLAVTEKMNFSPELHMANELHEMAKLAQSTGLSMEDAMRAVRTGYLEAEIDELRELGQ